MPAPNTHKISSSSHKLYHEALKFASLYVYLSIGYGTLLTGAGLQVAGAPVGFLLGLQDAPLGKPAAEGGPAQGGWAQSGALSLATAGVMGVLIGLMVRRCCWLDRSKACVVTNWHDLFKYTHMGRTIIAAMTAVLTWRGLNALKGFDGGDKDSDVGLGPVVLIGSAALSLATTASMHFLHFRIKAVYMEYGRLKRS